jgi:hypothetical protein
MGLIYAISVLVFVCVIASVYSNEVTRPYLTTKVVVFMGIVGMINLSKDYTPLSLISKIY